VAVRSAAVALPTSAVALPTSAVALPTSAVALPTSGGRTMTEVRDTGEEGAMYRAFFDGSGGRVFCPAS
jgi:hypothetical protein